MGLTVLDAGVVIAILDGSDAHHAAAVRAVAIAREAGDDLVLPASAYAESLVGPYRRGRDAAATLDDFVDALPARIEPVTRAIARAAAELRARHPRALRLPDALIVATAVVLGADRVVTTDAGWPRAPIPIEVLPTGAS